MFHKTVNLNVSAGKDYACQNNAVKLEKQIVKLHSRFIKLLCRYMGTKFNYYIKQNLIFGQKPRKAAPD